LHRHLDAMVSTYSIDLRPEGNPTLDFDIIPSRNKKAKLTIGVFMAVYDGYQNMLGRGVAQVARENDANVVYFAGAAIDDVVGFRKYWNAIYHLATPVAFDGLIFISGALKSFVSLERLNEFTAQFAPLPVISINQQHNGAASVTIDSRTGLGELMDHMIKDHQYKRIAFIRGPENFDEAENRYRIYREALERHHIPFDPDLVAPGHFLPDTGVAAVKLLLDERKVELDAIVCANDLMAFGAYEELTRRGIEVPTDIALTGFDDVPEARFFNVPLTTVSTVLVEQGRQAAQLLIDYFKTGIQPKDVVVDTALIIRESCGCLPIVSNKGIALPNASVNKSAVTFSDLQTDTAKDVQRIVSQYFPQLESTLLDSMVSAFFDVLQGETETKFLSTFKYILQKSSAKLSRNEIEAGLVSSWLEVLLLLREKTLPFRTPEVSEVLDDLLYQAKVIITKTNEQTHSNLRNQVDANMRVQSEMVRDINTATDISQIADILAENLPKLGMRTNAVALYQDDVVPAKQSRLIMLCHDGKRVPLEPEGRLFSSEELIPPDILPHDELPLLSIHPLVARDIHFGYILLEIYPGHWSLYNSHLALSEQIGAALHKTLLQQRIEQARHEAEQANIVKSQFLASMSHELRTPLNSILTFTELMEMGTFGDVSAEQQDYLQKIFFSGKHLLALINDVLDITKIQSGMLKLFYEHDFNIYKEIDMIAAAARNLLDDKPVELIMDIDPHIPLLHCDKRRVRQILLNLASNAVKFTEQGSVTLSAKLRDDHLLFSVIDTGPGIPEDQHEMIFEPFIQTETGIRHAGGTGLGLPISKSLVEAHGGQFWLESTLGVGSAFFVSLPLQPPQNLAEAHVTTQPELVTR
jgi:signal transduction histidine kinase/DNA-binding LacI/PurR family transcriptional regulator